MDGDQGSGSVVERALILAAGVGARLERGADARPKALLEFGGKSLLARHLEILGAAGVPEVVIAVGYQASMIEDEIGRLRPGCAVRLVQNPRFTEGSIVTLWTLKDMLVGGAALLMDADVLYGRAMIDRLLSADHSISLLFDRDLEPGDEPVKICIRDGQIVDFRKIVDTQHDFHGESVGFFKFSGDAARDLANIADRYVSAGRTDQPYEEAIRDLLLAAAPGAAGYVDVTGEPWIEIDFPGDIRRAETEILTRIRG